MKRPLERLPQIEAMLLEEALCDLNEKWKDEIAEGTHQPLDTPLGEAEYSASVAGRLRRLMGQPTPSRSLEVPSVHPDQDGHWNLAAPASHLPTITA